MTFIVIAPGLRDVVISSELFAKRPVEETRRLARAHNAPGIDEEHQPTEQQMHNQNRHPEQHYQQTAELIHERAPALIAEQIMSRPVVTLGPDSGVREAWRLFHEHRFRHLPVVETDRRIVGIVSERDLLRDAAGVGAAGPEPHIAIRPLIVTRVITALADTPIREVARVMFDQHIGAMPVVNKADVPIGIVTRSDILQALVKRAPLEMWV